MFTIDTDKTISITRGDSGWFVAPINYAYETTDVLRLKVFRKKACEDVVLQKDFKLDGNDEAVTIDGTTISLFLTEAETRIGEVISKPTTYWYEIELNPNNNPKTLVGYDEDGAKIFLLYPEGRDLEDDELSEEEKDTLRKLLEEFSEEERKILEEALTNFRKELPVIDSELDENSENPVTNKAITEWLLGMSDSIAEELKKFAECEKKANKLSEYTEEVTDNNYYSAKAVNEMYTNLGEGLISVFKEDMEALKTELQGDIDEIGDLIGGETEVETVYLIEEAEYEFEDSDGVGCLMLDLQSIPTDIENKEFTLVLNETTTNFNFQYSDYLECYCSGTFKAIGEEDSEPTDATYFIQLGENDGKYMVAVYTLEGAGTYPVSLSYKAVSE